VCDLGEKCRVEGSQDRENMRPVPVVGARALGCGYINKIMGEDASKLSFDMLPLKFWYSHVLKADNGGSLFKKLVHCFLTSLVAMP